jgi:hypothetical protein
MPGARVEKLLLITNGGVAAGITLTFILGLRGVHRFPTEAAIYMTILLVVLLSNAVYFWYHRRPSLD